MGAGRAEGGAEGGQRWQRGAEGRGLQCVSEKNYPLLHLGVDHSCGGVVGTGRAEGGQRWQRGAEGRGLQCVSGKTISFKRHFYSMKSASLNRKDNNMS